MAATIRLLLMAAVLQMGASVPAPEPDPHNIDINVNQELNMNGCCNGICPCGDKGDILTSSNGDSVDTLPPLGDCWFDNEPYQNGQFRYEVCLILECVDDRWKVIHIDPECGNCTFGGDPLVYPFDYLVTKTGVTNVISVNETCDFVMTQSGFVIPNAPGWPIHTDRYDNSPNGSAEFGVNANFIDYWTGRPNVAMNGITYYEDGISIKIHLVPGFGKLVLPTSIEVTTYPNRVGVPTTDGLPGKISCQDLMGMGSIFVFGAAGGRIEVTRSISPRDSANCLTIDGNKGLEVIMCEQLTSAYMPWAFIYADPILISAPSPTSLYGLCNTWTGITAPRFYDQTKVAQPPSNWQCPDNNYYGSIGPVPSLCDPNALTWKATPS